MERRRVIVSLFAIILIVGPLAITVGLTAARERALDPKVSRAVELASAEITGKVSYPDGTRLAGQVPVRVWSVPKAAFVHQAVTGKDGAYRLPALPQGTYQLVFADRVRVELRVTGEKDPKAAVLDVVIPHGRAVFADMPMEQKAAVLTALSAPMAAEGIQPEGGEPQDDQSSGLLPTLAIGAGGITAVAALAEWHDDDNRREVNSP